MCLEKKHLKVHPISGVRVSNLFTSNLKNVEGAANHVTQHSVRLDFTSSKRWAVCDHNIQTANKKMRKNASLHQA